MEILIERSGEEIHVSVPFALKNRAKKVSGYRWNPTLKVWAFPNTQAVFRELIAEFGDNARVEGFDKTPSQASESDPPEPTVQEQLGQKLKDQEALLLALSKEVTELKAELRSKSTALANLEVHLESKNKELEQFRKQVDSLKAAPEEQKLKQSVEFWKRAASEAERKYEILVKDADQPKRSPTLAPPGSADPFVQIVARAISIAGRDRDFQVTVNNTTLSRAALDLGTAAEKKLRKALGIPASDRRDFITVIREAAERRVISDEARGLLNFVRQNRNRVAHEQLSQSELWARSCIAILATSIVWPELQGAES